MKTPENSTANPTRNPALADAAGSAESEYWKCPWCGCDRDWFDRTIHYHADETEDGMKYRCEDCGRATDDIPPNDEPSESSGRKGASNAS
jgi:hypothetical protein